MNQLKLTDKEKVYYHIVFTTELDPTWSKKNQEVFDSQKLLMKSLLDREAIPDPRLKYFLDPEYNTAKTTLSRKQVFEKNGTRGDDILTHPHFKSYLEYFINGADMAEEVKEEAERLSNQKNIYDDISEALYVHVLKKKELYKLIHPRDWFAEEYYKLLIDYNVPPIMAKHYRGMIMKW